MARMQPRLRPQDVITVHWYPGLRSPALLTYMQDTVARSGTRDVWLTETGEKNLDDALQQARLLTIVDTFNRRPSGQWAKMFVYRFWGPDPDEDAAFGLLRQDFSSGLLTAIGTRFTDLPCQPHGRERPLRQRGR
jgi:hypothetical protein